MLWANKGNSARTPGQETRGKAVGLLTGMQPCTVVTTIVAGQGRACVHTLAPGAGESRYWNQAFVSKYVPNVPSQSFKARG